MPRWLVLVGVLFAALAVGFVLLSWWQYRTQPDPTGWPSSTATVTTHRLVPKIHGTVTEVIGRYLVNDVMIESVVMRRVNELRDGRWVPPPDTPAVGATLAVKYDPADPRRALHADAEPAPLMAPWRIVVVSVLLILGALCAFTPAAARRR